MKKYVEKKMPTIKPFLSRAHSASSRTRKTEKKEGRKGQICECVSLVRTVVLMKRALNVSKIRILGLPQISD